MPCLKNQRKAFSDSAQPSGTRQQLLVLYYKSCVYLVRATSLYGISEPQVFVTILDLLYMCCQTPKVVYIGGFYFHFHLQCQVCRIL